MDSIGLCRHDGDRVQGIMSRAMMPCPAVACVGHSQFLEDQFLAMPTANGFKTASGHLPTNSLSPILTSPAQQSWPGNPGTAFEKPQSGDDRRSQRNAMLISKPTTNDRSAFC